MANENAPAPRWKPIVAWTGKVMAVVGGGDSLVPGGARGRSDAHAYDPQSGRWLSLRGALALNEASWIRSFVTADGRVLLVDTHRLEAVALVAPDAGALHRIELPEELRGRSGVAAAWTGARLLLWGGYRQEPGYVDPCRDFSGPGGCDPPSPAFAIFSDGWEYAPGRAAAEGAGFAPAAATGCAADATHCCMPGGKLVRPGGCQPVYREAVQPAVIRGADGRCQRIECNVRCLPESARIATPAGAVQVSRLRAGDRVFTLDAAGRRVVATIARMHSVPAPVDHTLVELTLADGRVLRVSAGHPTAAGVPLERLRPGDLLDRAAITRIRHLPYPGAATWDLLPEGPTGTYWADGVLLGSTLRTAR
jgi:hypothetical protein